MSRLLHSAPRSLPLRRLNRGAPSATTLRYASNFLQNHPSPPRLPADQQAEFERLQRAAEAALSSHNTIQPSGSAASSPSPSQQPLTTSRHVTSPSSNPAQQAQQHTQATAQDPSAGSFSGGIRQGAQPEFEGDKNPKTGEVGGPKNEPLRWGSAGDWSYNGRVTDF
ncbi:Succinate dehydrogenase assembly factor 4, mitochondrial [Madurella mycetomatis]|uniref:Succinate dehydrogenase assembly factor 4, mitochondrial n=1 Tax=Madurella mycetomatis TaxID=100816 RepID=A0A175WHT5_9PEZI|nr:Succinate dehydrogenase assembly factor 4, mitochondrial [Madurella mycetomatis]